MLDVDSAVKMGFTGLKFGKAPYNSFSVIRSKFDKWLANKAAKAGAHLMLSTLVEDLVYEKTGMRSRKIDGVRLENGETIRADVVILAEGVQAAILQKAGMRQEIKPDSLTHYVKEVIHLGSEKIEERFQLEPGEGTVIGMIGYPTSGVVGKAGLWTCKETISLMVGGFLNQLIDKGHNPYQLLQRTKDHPLVKRLLEGGETVEFLSHAIPKGGYKKIPRLIDNGLLVVGDAAMMISGRRGSDLAMLTAKFAAETILQALAKGDFNKAIMDSYVVKVKDSFFMKDIQSRKGSAKYYAQHGDADFLVNRIMNEAAYKFFTIDLKSSSEKQKQIMEMTTNIQPIYKTFTDVIHGAQHWGVY
ncbi:MAG: FAD-dependent oxidoreductase [Halanaerobium sp.]|nr:FAD-dependent oxidoreductase [Halanaerobium sp.]